MKALLALKYHGIQKDRPALMAAAQREKIQDPWLPSKSEPEAIHQQNQRPIRQRCFVGLADESAKSKPEPLAKCRQLQARAAQRQVLERIAREKNITQG